MALDLFTGLHVFMGNFWTWYNGLTPLTFLLTFWPVFLIDFVRSVGKSCVLLVHALYRKLRPLEYDPGYMPKVSIIIPAHNEEAIIERAIESALETNYPNKEIIVVDDGSTDRTPQIAFPYSRKGRIKLCQRNVASGSKAGALNYGLFFASGDIIVTVDADTLIERNSLRELVKPLGDPAFSATSGNVRILRGEHGAMNLIVKIQAYEYLISMELGRRFQALSGTLLIISGAFGAFHKSFVKSIGQYDGDTITEDFDLTFKMRKLGKRLAFVPEAVSWTFAPETWKAWKRQRVRWTRGQAETLWKHRNLFGKRGFDLKLVLAVYDMLFIDVVLLFARMAWLIALLRMDLPTFPFVMLLSLGLYMFMELFTIVTAGLLSPRKGDLKYAYLTPIMVLFYRPYYAFVRLWAYISWVFKLESKW
ncbi:MAG: glycosyltransferase [Candidatus Bathyarchaeota archaeon]|nr:glycosyltransferase [Candidatus Bathyarchaeota archaeon]